MIEHRIDITDLVDRQKLNRFHVLTVTLCFLILFVDGLDFSAANVAGPALLRAFHAPKSSMGSVFGWGYFGIFLGSLVFGYVGDRFGRKTGAIAGVLAYSLPAIVTVFAGSLEQLSVLRFLAGLGIGGVIPNTIALLNETAPKRFRATFVMIAFIGYSTGTAAIGQVAARFIPGFGWPVVFLVAGIVGTGLGIVLFFLLPESVRFLTLVAPDSVRLKSAVSRIAPEFAMSGDPRFFLRDDVARKFSIRLLFSKTRWIATSLLWVGFFLEALTFMTLSSWLPVLLESAGLRPTQASFAYSYGALGAIVTVLVLSKFLDRFGPISAVLAALGCIAAVIYLAQSPGSTGAIIAAAILAYSCSSGTHTSLNATVGSFYPTSIRGNAVGYATGAGRIAGIMGPVITGYLLSAKVPARTTLYLIAAPYGIVAIVFFGLGLLYDHGLGSSATDGMSSRASETDPLPNSAANQG